MWRTEQSIKSRRTSSPRSSAVSGSRVALARAIRRSSPRSTWPPSAQVIAAALGAVAEPTKRTVKKAVLEGENGFLVWAVKTVLNTPASGPDTNLEAKVDAGGAGEVLSIECDPEDS